MSLPKHKLELSLEAAQDMADILRYTAQTWGRDQQDIYDHSRPWDADYHPKSWYRAVQAGLWRILL